MVTSIDGEVPDPAGEPDPVKREGIQNALAYMDLLPGTPIRFDQAGQNIL